MHRSIGIILLLLAASCSSPSTPLSATAAKPADLKYRRLADDYLSGYLAWRPQSGTSLGLHEYDGKATDFSRKSIQTEYERLRRFQRDISVLDESQMSGRDGIERRALLCAIENELFGFDVQRGLFRNPMSYASAFDLTIYAKRNFAPKPDRMRSATQILQAVPKTLAVARDNLEPNLPKVFIKTAIEQANGSADFFSSDLIAAFSDVKDDRLQARLKSAASDAATEMRAFAKWLETERLPRGTDDFAIGAEAYTRMLSKGELMTETPEQVLAIALRELKAEQRRFAEAAKIIDPDNKPLEVYKSIQRDHPSETTLIPDTIKHLEQIRQFVVERSLVSVPSDVRVKVEETPKFERATSFASMDSPGPFESKATEAFYYVTPTEPDWTPQRKEEWLTAFNYYATDVTTIHEAYPGHYVQNLHLRGSPASKTDKAFGSYAFIEGWAHYCEQMVVDESFPANADKIAAAKYRLEQSDEALLRLCRLCCSINMHTRGMGVVEATKFFMDNCYYEEAPAKQEAERGTYDPGYGFYTLGKLQILKLREDYRAQEGANFTLRKFHDEVLNHGQPPIRLLREILLTDRQIWTEALPRTAGAPAASQPHL